jgi:nicotinamide phosphoribosyltransferase
MEPNILLLTDSYKPTHWKQLPKGVTILRSYLESRGGKFDNTLFYGLQYIIKEYLQGKVITLNKINRAKLFWDAHLGPGHFNMDGWLHILEKHNGHLPVIIKAVPEGSVIPTGNVLLTIENTDPEVPWLTNYLESLLLQVWYPITVGTLSREIKKVLIDYLVKTSDHDEKGIRGIVSFMLHDFGFRGTSSVESAGIGASAHIINFRGTDTVEGILLAQEYYNTLDMLAFSIPASEHSTITSWTEPFEVKAFENMLDQFPTGLVACVSDSFDIIRACRDHWGTTLRDKILNRDGRLVIRPDSGDPVQTLKQIFHILWDKFGGTINRKGFKVIDPHVRVIQGDGVNYESIIEILDMMVEEGFAVENIAFGMGGALLQKVDRDTQKFAIKCSSIVINGEEVEVQKNPIEINEKGERVQSFKKSKAGRLKLVQHVDEYKNSDEYETVQHCKDFTGDILVNIFENGHILKEWTFEEVRERAEVKINVEELV